MAEDTKHDITTPIFPKSEVIIPRDPEHPEAALDAMARHLESRGPYFFSTLEQIGATSLSTGWEEITRDNQGNILKKPTVAPPRAFNPTNIPPPDSLFTGEGWCEFSNLVIATAVEKIITKNKLPFWVDISRIRVAYNREDWDTNGPITGMVQHLIAKITDHETQKGIFVDGAYGQIDHREAGKILTIPESKFPLYYKTTRGVSEFISIGRTEIEGAIFSDPKLNKAFPLLLQTLVYTPTLTV